MEKIVYNRMRKFIIPVLIAVTVATATYFFQAFTLLRQEGMGLFLNTPDFYRSLFLDPLPISHLIGGFLVQFYSNYMIGIAIVTAMVLGSYFIACGIFKRLGFPGKVLPTVFSCAAWLLNANASSPTTGIAIILISGCTLIILSFFKRIPPVFKKFPASIDLSLSLAALALTATLIGTGQMVRETEKWSKIEFAAIHGNWDFVLKHATIEEAEKNLEVEPWAFLALNAELKLESEYRYYPAAIDFGLDYGNIASYRSSLFYSLLYQKLGCYNEAIHHAYQSGDYLPHGTSFGTLRMLVQCNYEINDSLMVVKYCDILERSSCHGDFVNHFRKYPCPQRVFKPSFMDGEDTHLVFSKNQKDLLHLMYRAGIFSDMAAERLRCYINKHGSSGEFGAGESESTPHNN